MQENGHVSTLECSREVNVHSLFRNFYSLSLLTQKVEDSRTSPFQGGGNDENVVVDPQTKKQSNDPLTVCGPITRSKAKLFHETINSMIQSLFAKANQESNPFEEGTSQRNEAQVLYVNVLEVDDL